MQGAKPSYVMPSSHGSRPASSPLATISRRSSRDGPNPRVVDMRNDRPPARRDGPAARLLLVEPRRGRGRGGQNRAGGRHGRENGGALQESSSRMSRQSLSTGLALTSTSFTPSRRRIHVS